MIGLLNPERFSILISGYKNQFSILSRYLNDIKEMYRTLVECGHKKENIYVLYGKGIDLDLDNDGMKETILPASKTDLIGTLHKIKNEIRTFDQLFIFTTGVGFRDINTGSSILPLNGGPVSSSDFAYFVNRINCGALTVTMGQSYSGGFIGEFTGSNVVITTACRADESSYQCDSEGDWDEFLYHWTSAIRGKTPYGTRVNADLNFDRRLSLREAYEYAKMRDSQPEHPQYYEYPVNFGHYWNLCGKSDCLFLDRCLFFDRCHTLEHCTVGDCIIRENWSYCYRPDIPSDNCVLQETDVVRESSYDPVRYPDPISSIRDSSTSSSSRRDVIEDTDVSYDRLTEYEMRLSRELEEIKKLKKNINLGRGRHFRRISRY